MRAALLDLALALVMMAALPAWGGPCAECHLQNELASARPLAWEGSDVVVGLSPCPAWRECRLQLSASQVRVVSLAHRLPELRRRGVHTADLEARLQGCLGVCDELAGELTMEEPESSEEVARRAGRLRAALQAGVYWPVLAQREERRSGRTLGATVLLALGLVGAVLVRRGRLRRGDDDRG